MKILVTGGCGFIGSQLVRTILNKNIGSVVNVDKLTYAGSTYSVSSCEENVNYSHEKIDICDKNSLIKVYKLHEPDLVMHHAAERHVDRSLDSPNLFIKTNIIGTYNLLEVSRNYYHSLKSIKKKNFRFHHISTDEVYGDLGKTNNLFSESTPYNPSSPYSASKASSDHLVRAWHRSFDLPIVITNCSNNYGPYQYPEKLIPKTILNAIRGKPINIYGDGSQIRDWLYVEDHANALIKVAKYGCIGETYNIGGNNEQTNLNVVQTICQTLEELVPNKPKNLNFYSELIQFTDDRPGHDIRYAIDSSKIYNELNWSPKESFETGIKKTIEWFLNSSLWLKKISYKK